MSLQIEVFGDNSENINYSLPNIPVYIMEGHLSNFENKRTLTHWHDDIEILVILDGQMIYSVNGKEMLLKTGDGIIVNSGQLHWEFAKDNSECKYACFLFHPMLLCANEFIERNFVTPITKSPDFDFILLDEQTDWKRAIAESAKKLLLSYEHKEKNLVLKIQSEIFSLWSLLYENLPLKSQSKGTGELHSIKEMMSFIHKHYNEKLTLQDIADSVHICKSSCCALFKSKIHKSPIEYLTDYRLLRSQELLKEVEMSITEIAYEVGFSGASYFTESFRAKYGITPREFKKRKSI